MRILIVDDEAPARARVRRLLAAEAEADDVIEAASGVEAVAAITTDRPDLVLLDIQMPGLDGFGVIARVGVEAMPPVVFVTAYDEHALRAFEAQALDYLLKPIQPERFASMLARARRLCSDGATPAVPTQLEGLLTALGRGTQWLRHVMVHHDNRALLVPVSRVVRFSSDRNNVRIHVPEGVYAIRSTIAALEERLDPSAFLRISRSDIVRLDAVRELHPWSHGDYHVLLHDGTRLVWSRRYRAKGERILGA